MAARIGVWPARAGAHAAPSILGMAPRSQASSTADRYMPVTERTFTTTPSQLATALTRLADPPVVGVDVERADANRYWRKPALIQLGVDGQVVLVDPLAIEDLAPLNEFLRTRTIVLHAMENDIAPLLSVSVVPTVVEDTAVAAAGLGPPTGLETLLDQLLGVGFNGDKQRMQRADWAKRPRSDARREYAAADAADLPHLWTVLDDRLVATGRRSWYEQERDAVRGLPPIEERRSWTRLRGLGRLDRGAQTRARSLWQMRETLARDTDTAPNRILSDRALLDLAAKPVTDARGLQARGMRRQSTRRFGAQLLEALRNAKDATPITSAPRRLDDPHDFASNSIATAEGPPSATRFTTRDIPPTANQTGSSTRLAGTPSLLLRWIRSPAARWLHPRGMRACRPRPGASARAKPAMYGRHTRYVSSSSAVTAAPRFASSRATQWRRVSA